MTKKTIRHTLAFLFLISVCGGAFAAIEIGDIRWQVPQPSGVRGKLVYTDVPNIDFGNDELQFPKFRIAAAIKNISSKPAEAGIVRCAFSMRLVRLDGTGESVWAVPFWTEERRFSKIKPGASAEMKIYHIDVAPFLKRLRASGYWPDAMKIQFMPEPRPGDNIVVSESLIENPKNNRVLP
ncbi:MAG: hypothetical protein WCS77_03740 [Elusimicrobiaceae bacterium]